MKNKEAYITFSVGSQLFCLAVQHVKGILELPKVYTVPQAPDFIMGVVNVDGEVIPLINATVKLKMGEYAPPENPTMLVLERTHDGKIQNLCLHICEVVEVQELLPSSIEPLPTSRYEFDERLVDGMFKVNDEFVMQINVDNFFRHNLEELNLATI